MSKETPTRKTRRTHSEAEYGFEYWYQRYNQWVLDNDDKKVVYAIGALVISAVLIAVATLVPMHQTVATVIASPAGVFFFLIPLGLLFSAEAKDPTKLRFKDRIPPTRRRRFAFIGAILLVVILIGSGSVLPYALGGTIMVAAVLGLYNIARRTPEEIALAVAGIPDPRETTVLVGDEETGKDAIADTTEDETDSPREA